MNAFMPPPMPPWEGLHPLVVHFPIALLLVVPLFMLFGFLPRVGRGFSFAALVLLVLGTVSAYVAVETGEAAGGLAVRSAEINEVLEEHEELAEASRTTFAIITLAYAVVALGIPFLPKRVPAAIPIIAQAICIAAALAGGMLIANTGHLGGRLVHDLGVQAWFSGGG